MDARHLFSMCIGLIGGPMLLSVCQAVDHHLYCFIVYGTTYSVVRTLCEDIFRGPPEFYGVGAMLVGVSAGLMLVGQKQRSAIARSLIAFGLPASLMVSVVTVFDGNFLSGIGYVGALATPGLWAARVALNATVQWRVAFIVASWSAMKQIGRG